MIKQVVKEVKNTDTGAITTIDPVQVRQVISKQTANTMMDMLERVDDMPVDLATEANMFSGIKLPAPGAGDGHDDSIDIEIATLILQLSSDKKREAVNYLRYLVEREDKRVD